MLARISDSPCETVSHLVKEIMKSQKAVLPINVHTAAVLNSSVFAVYDYLPLIYTFMRKKSPLGFSSVKRCFCFIIKRLRSQTDRNHKKKSRFITGNHVMGYLVH